MEEHLLRVVFNLGVREKIDIPMYEGNLDTEEFLDWIREMDKYFDYEDVEEEKKVGYLITRLGGMLGLRNVLFLSTFPFIILHIPSPH